jgi:HlyD family secretion protein
VKRTVGLAILLLAGAAGGIWWWTGRSRPAAAWQGYAEADFIKVGPTQQGLITALHVDRGDAVAAGAPLFDQDDTEDCAARDQAERLLAQAEKQVANLEEGAKPTEIAQAEANLADARAVLVRTATDLARGESLVSSGAASRQNVDQLRADYLSSRAKVEALQAALAQSRSPLGREQEIAAQRAGAEAARAALAMAEWRLGQRHVAAPVGGRVADVLARPGETVAAGAPVVSLLAPERIFVRFFVPEAAVSTLHRGDQVALACDGCAGGLRATIAFISPQAEYTPPLIYSETTSAKLVFLIEARPAAEQAMQLNPGQPVLVRPSPANAP